MTERPGDRTTTWHPQERCPLSYIKVWKMCFSKFTQRAQDPSKDCFGSQGAAHFSTHFVISPNQRVPRCQFTPCHAIISHRDDVTACDAPLGCSERPHGAVLLGAPWRWPVDSGHSKRRRTKNVHVLSGETQSSDMLDVAMEQICDFWSSEEPAKDSLPRKQ